MPYKSSISPKFKLSYDSIKVPFDPKGYWLFLEIPRDVLIDSVLSDTPCKFNISA